MPTADAATAVPTTADGFTQNFANRNNMVWSGGDQNTSYKAPNGKVYWVGGDTILSNGVDLDGSYPDTGTVMVGNHILMQNGGDFVNAMANNATTAAVPDPPTHTAANQERYWPSGIIQANGYMYVLCQRVINDASGFRTIGAEVARFTITSTGKLTFNKMISTPSTGVAAGVGPAFTQWSGDMLLKDGYAYVYGYTSAPQNDPNWALHYTYVARVPSTLIESKSSWRFFKKSTGQWVSSTASLSTASGSPDAIMDSQVGSVRVINGKVVMLHKPWNGWGSAVYMEVGGQPQGPFVRTKVFDSPAGTWNGKNYETYAPMLHPEQVLGGIDAGKLLVSINWNGKDFYADTLANADVYKPRFYAVPMP
jgi:hypothetical protein